VTTGAPLSLTVARPSAGPFRALILGCALGSVFISGNLYLGLKLGWGDTGNVAGALLGFALIAAFQRRVSAHQARDETNLVQTTAAAAAGMSFGSGLVSSLPALGMLGHPLPGWELAAWVGCLGLLGAALGLALRQRMIVTQPLTFPTGLATAELIETVHSPGGEGFARARLLGLAAGGAMLFVALRDGLPGWIPAATFLPSASAGIPAAPLGLGISWSPMMLGIGGLVGLRTSLSLLLGSLVGWGGLAPWLVSGGVVAEASFDALAAWLLWPGVSLMVAASLSSLLLDWRQLYEGFRELRQLRPGSGPSTEVGRLPLLLGIPAAVVAAALGAWSFGLGAAPIFLGLALSCGLAMVCARASGLTDIMPITQLGQLTQILLGLLFPNQLAAGLLASTMVTATSTQAAFTLGALKTGERLKTPVRTQLLAQVVGLGVGAALSVPVYWLLAKAYGIGSAELPAPAARTCKAIYEAMQHGLAALPPFGARAALIAALIGVLLTVVERFGRARLLLPSAMAMGIGFLAPTGYGVAMCVGALVLVLLNRRRPGWGDTGGFSVVSGLIAGESVVGVLIAGLRVALERF
jgi:putative OPT family oligopeptide transporter